MQPSVAATVVGRVSLDYGHGVFGVITAPDETTPDAVEMPFWVAPQTLEQQHAARRLRPGDLVSARGPCRIRRLYDPQQTGPGQRGLGICVRTEQMEVLGRPRRNEAQPRTWARLTVTAPIVMAPVVQTGEPFGVGVYIPVVVTTEQGDRVLIQAYLEGTSAGERAGMERVAPERYGSDLVPGTWISFAGRLGHVKAGASDSVFVVETQHVERLAVPA
jgi:hypothetical protein